MKWMVSSLAAAAAVGLGVAHAQAPPEGEDMLRLKNILRHMAQLPFAPQYVPPGFSGEPLRLRRSGPNAPVQIVEARLAPRGQISFQVLARPMAAQLLNEAGGAPMMGPSYTAHPMGAADISAVGRKKTFHIACWTGKSSAPGQPDKDLCAFAVDPEIIVVASVDLDPAGGVTAASSAALHARAIAAEGLSYWIAIDEQMETETIQRILKRAD
jgi:hypothetical protein